MSADPRSSVGGDRLGPHGDALYARLVEAHDGLSEAQSAELNARLVLILMNAVGDPEAIPAAIDLARSPARSTANGPTDRWRTDDGRGRPDDQVADDRASLEQFPNDRTRPFGSKLLVDLGFGPVPDPL